MQTRHHRSYPLCRIPIIHPVIFYDDCNGTYDYTNAGDGGDYVAAYSTDHVLVGTNAIKLWTKATAPANGDTVSIQKGLWLSPHKIATLEVCFSTTVNVNSFLTFYLYWYDGSYSRISGVRFTHNGAAVSYMNSGATFTALSGWRYNTSSNGYWNHLTLATDLTSGYYSYIIVNDQIQDMSAIAYPASASATAAVLLFYCTNETDANAISKYYIDQVLVRADNP